ncbi:MAG: DUF2169 domain-containing protein [Chitinispirillaceae bacterium]
MWQTQIVQGTDLSNKPILSVLAKRTYSITHKEAPREASQQIPITLNDTYDDEANPASAEVTAESELVAFKPSTDLVVLGKAKCPSGKLAYFLDCEVKAGPYKKTIRVFGNRKLQAKALRGLSLSDPEPFSEMPLGYRYAYGGNAVSKNGTAYSFYPNPIGRGFTLKGSLEDASEVPVPNIEDPSSPLNGEHFLLSKFSEWTDIPAPVSLGWTRKNFYPRYTFCGVLPEHLEGAMNRESENSDSSSEKGKVPVMDHLFYQGASEGLYGKRLAGNELVQLTNLDSAHPTFQTVLPAESPTIVIDIGNGKKELEPVLDTVVIHKEQNLITLLWRGSLGLESRDEISELKKLEWQAR